MKSCFVEFIIGTLFVLFILAGYALTIVPEGQEFIDSSPLMILSVLIVITCMGCIFAAAKFLQSAPAAAAVGIPGATGCAQTLAVVTGILVLIGFCLVGAAATVAGGGG